MSSVACRVCLRTNVPMLDLPFQLNSFCDELCDFESVQHKRLKYCALCAHQMQKCYKFKGQCLRANELLKLWITDENKDISEYHKELPSQSLQITNNSTSSLFECQHDEKTLHNTNVTSDCNRNLVLKLNRSALAPDDRTHPESSEPSLKSNPSIPDRPYPDLRPTGRLSSGLRPGLRHNIGSRPTLRPNCGLRPVFRPNLSLRPAFRPNVSVSALKPNSSLGLDIQLVPSGSKQPKQTVLTFDHDYVSYETDPLALVKDEIAMDIDKNSMESAEETIEIGDEESVVEIEHQRIMKEVYIDDNNMESDTIASVLEIEQKEVDNNECTIGSTKPEVEELYNNESMDNKEGLINNDIDIDSDEYTYEYLEQDIDLLDLAKQCLKPRQEESSESTNINKKQYKKTTVKKPQITIIKIEDVSNKYALQPAQNENNIRLEAQGKRVTRKCNKKTKVNLNLEYPYISDGPKAVPTFKASCLIGLFNESDSLVLDDETVLTKELFSAIYDKLSVRELKRLAVILLEDEYREKLMAYLGVLYRKYNPEYESIFNVEYLHTHEMKKEEFKRRELHPDYIRAAYKCELCFRTYTGQSFLDSHKKTHHDPANPFVCSICSYTMTTKTRLVKHRLSVHLAAYSCKLCPLRTNLVAVMRKHYYSHKGVEYQCPVCLKVCYNANTLNTHKRRAHATHVCPTCGIQYTSEKGLRIHRETQHKDAPPVEPAQTVPCAPCGITFDTRQSYLRHCNIAHTPLRIDRFPRRNRVRPPPTEPTSPKVKKGEHKQDVKGKQNKKKRVYRTCEVCHEKVHVERFGGIRLYKHFLEKHPGVPYHAKDMKAKDFLCDECGKAFQRTTTLRDHKNWHTGLRPYMCELCPARFHAKGNLWKHRVQKHCEPRHRCEECGKLFKNATHLRTHMRIHIGDRRFKCRICDKGFLENGALNEHVKAVHYKERRVKKPKTPTQNSLTPVSE